MTTSNEPEASSSAGMQKRARNLAAEELFIEVMEVKGESFLVKQGLNISITNDKIIKIIVLLLMFG